MIEAVNLKLTFTYVKFFHCFSRLFNLKYKELWRMFTEISIRGVDTSHEILMILTTDLPIVSLVEHTQKSDY